MTGRVLAVIQARMGSTRLPGKVLAPLAHTTVLGLLLQRLDAATLVDTVAVATTTKASDDTIAAEATTHGAHVVRGPEDDVLARFLIAVDEFDPDVVVRLTADCPLVDPALVDSAVARVLTGEVAVASYGSARYLRGFDVEVFTAAALRTAARAADEAPQRVHVTPYLYQHPEQFPGEVLPWPVDHGHLRLTVDTPEDLQVVTAVVERVADPLTATWAEFAAVLEADPSLAAVNAHVRQKAIEDL